MAQHYGLTKERWSSFSIAQQILMIANEMNRAKRLFYQLDRKGLSLCYERILYMTDLTLQTNFSRGLARELLRWRDLAAQEYVCSFAEGGPDINRHLKIFRALLLLNRESAAQIPYLLPV